MTYMYEQADRLFRCTSGCAAYRAIIMAVEHDADRSTLADHIALPYDDAESNPIILIILISSQ